MALHKVEIVIKVNGAVVQTIPWTHDSYTASIVTLPANLRVFLEKGDKVKICVRPVDNEAPKRMYRVLTGSLNVERVRYVN